MLTSGKLKDYFSGTESNDVSSFMKEVGAESKSVRVVNMDVSLKFYDSSSSGVLTRTLRSRIFNVVPIRRVQATVIFGPVEDATLTVYDVTVRWRRKSLKGENKVTPFSPQRYERAFTLVKELDEEVPPMSTFTMEVMAQAFSETIKRRDRCLEIVRGQREGRLLAGYVVHPANPAVKVSLAVEYAGYDLVDPLLVEVFKVDDLGPVNYRVLGKAKTEGRSVVATLHRPKVGLHYAIYYALS